MKNRVIRDKKELTDLIEARKKASDVKVVVEEILEEVREKGDTALIRFSNEFDKTSFSSSEDFVVSRKEIEESIDIVGEEFISAVNRAIENIRDFYSRMQRPKN